MTRRTPPVRRGLVTVTPVRIRAPDAPRPCCRARARVPLVGAVEVGCSLLLLGFLAGGYG
ncbi:hypothetical protein [Streptomyces hydrogenans]